MENLAGNVSGRFSQGVDFVKALVARIRGDDIFGLSAEMAFNLILTFIPALIFLVSLLGLLGQQMDLLPVALDVIENLAPAVAQPILEQTLLAVVDGSSGELTIIGLLVALWAASNGAVVLIKALDRAYRLSPGGRSYWSMRAMALAEQLINITGIQRVLIDLLRWGIAILGITFFSAYVYAMVPSQKFRKIYWQGTLPGAAVFVLMWVTISLAMGFYLQNIGQLNIVYGVLGAIVILMTWVYFSSLSMLIGGEVAALLGRVPQQDKKNGSPPA
jgi:membrane protein